MARNLLRITAFVGSIALLYDGVMGASWLRYVVGLVLFVGFVWDVSGDVTGDT